MGFGYGIDFEKLRWLENPFRGAKDGGMVS